jgi:hypothetical protein
MSFAFLDLTGCAIHHSSFDVCTPSPHCPHPCAYLAFAAWLPSSSLDPLSALSLHVSLSRLGLRTADTDLRRATRSTMGALIAQEIKWKLPTTRTTSEGIRLLVWWIFFSLSLSTASTYPRLLLASLVLDTKSHQSASLRSRLSHSR